METETVRTTPLLGQQAGSVMFSQWSELCRLLSLAISRGDTGSIHDLRVASRRLRATVGLFKPFVDHKSAKRISKELQKLTRTLGRLRNVDEALIYFGVLPEPLPGLIQSLGAARSSELNIVAGLLRQFPRQALDRLIREAVAELAVIPPGDAALPAYLSETSISRYQAVHNLLPAATDQKEMNACHILRIAIKKWRYLLETVGQVRCQDYSTAVENLKTFQTLLGNLNDLAEFGRLCTRLDFPEIEQKKVKTRLKQDIAEHLAQFVSLAASHPPQYIYLP